MHQWRGMERTQGRCQCRRCQCRRCQWGGWPPQWRWRWEGWRRRRKWRWRWGQGRWQRRRRRGRSYQRHRCQPSGQCVRRAGDRRCSTRAGRRDSLRRIQNRGGLHPLLKQPNGRVTGRPSDQHADNTGDPFRKVRRAAAQRVHRARLAERRREQHANSVETELPRGRLGGAEEAA